MISGQFGVGYFTWEAYSLVQYPDIALGMIAIVVIGGRLLLKQLFRAVAWTNMPEVFTATSLLVVVGTAIVAWELFVPIVGARVIDAHEDGAALRDQAVLVRAAHHSDMLEIELSARKVPYVKFGGLRFTDTAHVKDFLALLDTYPVIRGQLQAAPDVSVQAEDVPVQRAARGHRLVGEPVHLVQGDARVAHLPGHHPAAGGAQVDRCDGDAGHLRNAAATPASTGMSRPVVSGRSPAHSAQVATTRAK